MSNLLTFARAQLQAVFKDFNTLKEFERLVERVNMSILDISQNTNGGYVKFGNGLLMQWGNNDIPGAVWTAITLPISFIDTNYTAIVTLAGGGVRGIVTYNNTPIYKDKAMFKCYVEGSPGVNYSVAWVTIGLWK